MPNPASENDRSGSAQALVEHLRRNPGESRGDPAALAARFGLEPEFVRRALARLPGPARDETPRRPSRIAERAGGLLAWADEAIERASVNPVRFEAFSFLAAIGLSVALSPLLPHFVLVERPTEITLRNVVAPALFLVAGLVQMAVFYRRRMTRYALYGGLVCWVGTALSVMVALWWRLRGQPEVGRGLQVFSVGLAMGLVGALYAALAALASLAGGWVNLRREDREWERLSRQELLERYFELGRRLERSVAAPEEPLPWESWPPLAFVRTRPILAALLVGVGSGMVHLALTTALGGMRASFDTLAILLLVKSAFSLALFVATAFLSGKPGRGAWCGGVYQAALSVATFLSARSFAPLVVSLPLQIAGSLVSLALYAAIGALLGLGATIQRRAAHDRRMASNDGATLVAEMLEIQWRLEEDATSVTVLVVDAAKSTAMKVGADPLDVEYSFREYQMWIAECCAGFGGRIHSVAGDGAVVAFGDGAAAMAAARRIQTDLERFNARNNRLPRPFRLRLGLHAGRVAGDLNDVQFTEVIDIAAHVEDIAPVGGIAATGAVVSTIGEDGFLPLARDVDGQPVYIALVPTEA